MNPNGLDRISDRGLTIVGLALLGVAVAVLAATTSARATFFAIVIGGIGAGACGGSLLRRHTDRVDRDAGLSPDR